MSTYHSTFTLRKGTGSIALAPYCVLTGLLSLLIVQSAFFLTPNALAVQRAASPENLARMGVSVVRIVTNYTIQAPTPNNAIKTSNPTESNANANSFSCTGLGVIIASWVGETNEQDAYILTDGSLTDGSLVNNAITCGNISLPGSNSAGNPGVTPLPQSQVKKSSPNFVHLSNINVYLSSAYSTSPIEITINGTNIVPINGASLIRFHNNTPLPLAVLSGTNDPTLPDAAAIQLIQPSTPLVTPTTSTPQHYLTPKTIAAGNTSNFESGTPIVDQHGYLNKIYLKNRPGSGSFMQASDIQAQLVRENLTPGAHTNAVNTSWQNGMTAYFQGKQSTANKDFSQAFNNSKGQFQGAQTYATMTNGLGTPSPSGINSIWSNGITLPIIGHITYLLLAIIAGGVILFLALLVLLSLLFGRGKRNTDLAERNKLAALHDRQAKEQVSPQVPMRASAPPGPSQSPVRASTPPSQQPVQFNSVYSASPVSNSVANASQFSPVLMNQSRASADYPTVELHNNVQERSSSDELEKTQPYPHSQQSNTPLPSHNEGDMAFDVITNTNPGIKRKYKPNEDSLFAVRGVRDDKGQLQKIGLFVVADGMGGHANGQDASRLAIQTIIDYILPRLAHNEANQENAEKLLVDSVQRANQAVHQHNIENNADMGTTVTATLIIDNTAHVANVGDSRTYLYRTSDGLKKVTRDHSVVASLVDAGIIKEDDIYTHPKRNQIYRSLGEKPFVEVDPFTVQLQAGDKILMCSDGLWDMVRDPLIKQVLEKPVSETKQIGSDLINAALEGGGEDNVSVIVVNVVNHAPQQSKAGLDIIYLQDNVQMPTL